MSDLIDRETLRHAMYEEAFMKDSNMQKWDSGCWIRYKMFERVLASIPSVERKKGKLLFANPFGECSVCGWLIDYRDGFNFCPHCGTDIRGSED